MQGPLLLLSAQKSLIRYRDARGAHLKRRVSMSGKRDVSPAPIGNGLHIGWLVGIIIMAAAVVYVGT